MPLSKILFVALLLASAASASTVNGNISGTCGFYVGTPSNIVYSHSFTGDGTFCTGFLPGGSFTNSSTLEAGDIYSLAHATVDARAPAGYGVFANFNATLQMTQQYLLTPPVASTTATGYAKTFIDDDHVIDDGTGGGECFEKASLSVNGVTSPHPTDFSLPITFGQPISAVETASISCSKSSLVGFGEDGALEYYAATPLLTYDAHGNLLGPATLTTVPEPPATALLLIIALCSFRRFVQRTRTSSLLISDSS